MDRLEGGYLLHKADPIMTGWAKHTVGLEGRPISAMDLEATNLMQNTAWAVDRGVESVARELFAASVEGFGGNQWRRAEDRAFSPIPTDTFLPLPAPIDPTVWETMDDVARRPIKQARAKVFRENDARKGKRFGFEFAMDTADRMLEHPEFYFVVQHDFRLRRYFASAGGLNPQGSDIQKALLRFSRGMALGASGYFWLCIRAANTFGGGVEKMSLNDRYEWAVANGSLFEKIAANPTNFDLWHFTGAEKNGRREETDEPWSFLATALELAQANRCADRADFISHLSVPMDGTCNGLQHLSAMGLDEIGGEATNLVPGLPRQDCYLRVLQAAMVVLERDSAAGHELAKLWLPNMHRGVVKRGVMTTPYGVTDSGIQRQLLQDGMVPDSEHNAREASAYMRDVILEALGATVVQAKRIMAWLQASAEALGKANRPMDWVNPNGSTLRQAYYKRKETRVETLVGRAQFFEEVAGGLIDAKKQALGAAPQVVHSFDAAHLARTVVRANRDHGVVDFAMIHDSYGCHAGRTEALAHTLRASFRDIYKVDWMGVLAEKFRAQGRDLGVEIADPPARGTLDIDGVMDAEFFFS